MIIISHRGYWIKAVEKNTGIAFKRSFEMGFGTETDIRDRNGDLVIAHDAASSESISLTTFFDYYGQHDLLLALNIKADGLQEKLLEYIEEYRLDNYFVFDMSVPDTLLYLKKGMNVFCRQSEFEPITPLYDQCKGVWLDAFNGTWYDESVIAGHLSHNKKVAVVSDELHGREHAQQWKMLKEMECVYHESLVLCTDVPEEATEYFKQ